MSLLTLEMLDSQADIARWLEHQLTGEDLTKVVAELLGWKVGSDENESLEQVFGNHLPEILESGLLESDAQMLLRYPRLLLELQEQICVSGSMYWFNLGIHGRTDRSSGTGDIIPPNLSRMLAYLEQQAPSPSAPVPQKSSKPKTASGMKAEDRQVTVAATRTTSRPKQVWSGRAIALLAFVFLAGFGVLLFNQNLGLNILGPGDNVATNDKPVPIVVPPVNNWGLNDLKPIQANKTGADYLNAVAKAMNDWNERAPTDSRQGAQRIQQLIDGCQNLIAAEQMQQSPLAEADREWLHEKCTAWIKNFGEDLAALDAAPDAWPEVSSRMNEKINKAVKAIRDRAETLNKSVAA